jgi:hypothetical protein
MQGTFGQMFPFANLEEMGKQNIALFERTMKMFSPFAPGTELDGTSIAASRSRGRNPRLRSGWMTSSRNWKPCSASLIRSAKREERK